MTVEPVEWYRPGNLLEDSPVFVHGSGCVAAVLSPAGRQALFDHGRAALQETLLENEIDPAHHQTADGLDWVFVEPAVFGDQSALTKVLGETHPRWPTIAWRDERPHEAELLLHIPENLAWFDGHFPGDAILPAVVQIDWAISFGQPLGFSPAGFRGLERLKFTAVISPDTVLRLTLRTDGGTLEFAYSSAGKQHSKGRIVSYGHD